VASVSQTTHDAASERLKITEIFFSLQGETRTTGLPTVFIRLTGCPLRCSYCDTTYAFTGGHWMTLVAILSETSAYDAYYVTVTGGEPLAQKGCLVLLEMLCDQGYEVSLETSGAFNISEVDQRVIKVMDIKTPSSGEHEHNRVENLKCLDSKDQIKFVICNQQDYEWCKSLLQQYQLHRTCEVLFSPSHEQLNAARLAEWILADRLPVRFQIQLHKYLWGDVPGR